MPPRRDPEEEARVDRFVTRAYLFLPALILAWIILRDLIH